MDLSALRRYGRKRGDGTMASVKKAFAFLPGRDEFEYLATRRTSAPFGEEAAEATLRQLARRARTFDGTSGGEAHEQGTMLVELYTRHADVVMGHRSFRTLLTEYWPLGLSAAYRRMRLARATTQDKAIAYGYTRCLLGLRLMKLTGAVDFDDLAKRKLPMPAQTGGGFIQFPAKVEELRGAIRELVARSQPDAVAALPRATGSVLTEARKLLDAMMAEDDAVASLHPRAHVRQGRLHFPVRAPSTATEVAAAARLYTRLAKVLR